MSFEWDNKKNIANLKKHGIRFEEAIEIFNGPVLTMASTQQDHGERRSVSIGALAMAVVIAVVHTDRNGNTRVISARRANRRERRKYYEHIEKAPG